MALPSNAVVSTSAFVAGSVGEVRVGSTYPQAGSALASSRLASSVGLPSLLGDYVGRLRLDLEVVALRLDVPILTSLSEVPLRYSSPVPASTVGAAARVRPSFVENHEVTVVQHVFHPPLTTFPSPPTARRL